MPSRAASVQIKIRSGSSAGSALKRRFSSSRRMRGVDPVKQAIRSSGLQVVERLGQPPFQPAARVFVFREQDQPTVIPSAVARHVRANPRRQPVDARVRLVSGLPGDAPASRRQARGR